MWASAGTKRDHREKGQRWLLVAEIIDSHPATKHVGILAFGEGRTPSVSKIRLHFVAGDLSQDSGRQ